MTNRTIDPVERDNLYRFALLMLERADNWIENLIFHHVYSLKVGNDFVITSEKEVQELVEFLTSKECTIS
ncbi:MAG: hypothetical protein ACEPOZ_08935 [Marinifilaceae bacterium]|jgi:hypothetical protein